MNSYKKIFGGALLLQLAFTVDLFANPLEGQQPPQKTNPKGKFIDIRDDDVINLDNIFKPASDDDQFSNSRGLEIEANFGLVSSFNNNFHFLSERRYLLSSWYMDAIQALTDHNRILNKKYDFLANFHKKIELFNKLFTFVGSIGLDSSVVSHEDKLAIKKLYLRNEILKFGRDSSLFNEVGAVWGGAYSIKFKNDVALVCGIEEFVSPEAVDHADFTLGDSNSSGDFCGKYNNFSIFPNSVSYAVVSQGAYNKKWGGLTVTALITYADIYANLKVPILSKSFQKLLYGANVALKFILKEGESLKDKTQDVLNAKLQFVDGMSEYVTDCDLPKYNGLDFEYSNKAFFSAKILSGCLKFDHFWNDSVSSGVYASGFYLLNNSVFFEKRQNSLRWFDNALSIAIIPYCYKINNIVTISPIGKMKIGNVLQRKKMQNIITFCAEINVSCAFKVI